MLLPMFFFRESKDWNIEIQHPRPLFSLTYGWDAEILPILDVHGQLYMVLSNISTVVNIAHVEAYIKVAHHKKKVL